MEFFGVTQYGPQDYIGDLIKEGYREPTCKEEVQPLMQNLISNSTCPEKIQRPDVSAVRLIDCYTGRVNGFAYGSIIRFNKMKLKGVIKPVGPADIYRLPPTTSVEVKMPRNLVRKTSIGLHTEEQMCNALELLSNGQTMRAVAKSTGVPYTTLYRYHVKITKNPDPAQPITPNYAKIQTDPAPGHSG